MLPPPQRSGPPASCSSSSITSASSKHTGALFIPDAIADSCPGAAAATGRRIHATGDARNGFRVEFDRDYDRAATGRAHSAVSLGHIPGVLVDDGAAAAARSKADNLPCDQLERLAAMIPAPGPSLRSQANRVQIKDCQSWLRDFVAVLVGNGVLGAEALITLNAAPQH